MALALASLDSSLASRFQLGDRRKMMFSPTLVVSICGPLGSFSERPNLGRTLRSATRGLTTSRWVTMRMRRVVLTFLPSSSKRYVIVVLVPSLFWMVWGGGNSVDVVSSRSSSSAQSLQSNQCQFSGIFGGGRGFVCLCAHLALFDIMPVFLFPAAERFFGGCFTARTASGMSNSMVDSPRFDVARRRWIFVCWRAYFARKCSFENVGLQIDQYRPSIPPEPA